MGSLTGWSITKRTCSGGPFENVATLARPPRDPMTKKPTGPSNLDMACSALRSRANMFTHCWELGPRLFGSPQARARLWIGLLPLRALRDLQLTEKDASLWLNELMQRCVGGQRTDVHDYLSEETGPEVMAKYRKFIASHFCEQRGRAGTHSRAWLPPEP